MIHQATPDELNDAAMYQHEEYTRHITLNACQANRIALENGALVLSFPDGIGILPGHPLNDTEDIHETDAAEVRFPLRDPEAWQAAIDMCVFSREDKHGECTRKPLSPKKLLKKISDDCRMEIVALYTGEMGALLKGYLWFDEKPYSKEFELELACLEPLFCWNRMTDSIR